MKFKKLLAALLAVMMVASMAACGSSGTTSTTSAAADNGSAPATEASTAAADTGNTATAAADGEVSVFYYTFADTYISSVRTALDAQLDSAGIKYTDYDGNGNQTTQTEAIQTAISKGTSMLIVNLVDSGSEDAANNIINMAKDKDIPVVFFNRAVSTAEDGGESVISSYDKCAFIGTDYEMAGHMQGQMIGDYLVANYDKLDLNGDGKISYVMFKGDEANAEAIARTQYGVEDADKVLTDAGKSALEFYDSANSNKYLVDQNGTWSAQAATEYMQTILSQYSEANNNMVELVIANNDDMALGAISALQNAGYNKFSYINSAIRNEVNTIVEDNWGGAGKLVQLFRRGSAFIQRKTILGICHRDSHGFAGSVENEIQFFHSISSFLYEKIIPKVSRRPAHLPFCLYSVFMGRKYCRLFENKKGGCEEMNPHFFTAPFFILLSFGSGFRWRLRRLF